MTHWKGLRLALILLLACGGRSAPAADEPLDLATALEGHVHPLALAADGVTGPGAELLFRAAGESQFIILAEEHDLRELNDLSASLFEQLAARHDYRYAVVESGSVFTEMISAEGIRGDLEAISSVASRYPYGPTFATDQELAFFATVGRSSKAAIGPVWGVDQEFAALHVLDRLASRATTPIAKSRISTLADAARPHDSDRSGDHHYISELAAPEDFADLPTLFSEEDLESQRLIRELQRSIYVYGAYHGRQGAAPTRFDSGRQREEDMRSRFMDRYRAAQAAGDPLPRALVKMGHWHTTPGFFRANVPTFGNFLCELARGNGLGAFVVYTLVIDSSEAWRNSGSALGSLAGEGTYTLIDLRPLRPLVHHERLAELPEVLRELIFRVDAALVIRGGHTGTYEVVKPTTVETPVGADLGG